MTVSEKANIASIIASSVQAVSTIILIWVTVQHLKSTKETIKAMDKTSKTEFLPILVLGTTPQQCDQKIISVYIKNVGRGIAKKPMIVFPGKAPLPLYSVHVDGEDRAKIEYDFDYILQLPPQSRKIYIEYQDVFNRKIKTEAELIEVNNLGANGKGKGIGWNTWTPIIP